MSEELVCGGCNIPLNIHNNKELIIKWVEDARLNFVWDRSKENAVIFLKRFMASSNVVPPSDTIFKLASSLYFEFYEVVAEALRKDEYYTNEINSEIAKVLI